MKSVIAAPIFAVALLSLFVFVWVLFPADIPARQSNFEPVSASEFASIRGMAIEFERSIGGAGVVLNAGDVGSNVFQFDCNQVPLLMVVNSQDVLSVMTFAGSERRAPKLRTFLNDLIGHLVPMQGSVQNMQELRLPTGFEAFLLKHRDGIDLGADCSGELR